MNELEAEMLLLKCRGDEIWSVEMCRQKGIPESWIDELQDCFESGFDSDRNSLYEEGKLVNQYYGVSDLMIAYRLASFLGIDTERIRCSVFDRCRQVDAMKAELDEL